MLSIGNGGVSWAELVIPSGVTSLMVALVPLWMVLVDWLRPKGIRPRAMTLTGLAIGFVGVAVLAGPVRKTGETGYFPGFMALMLACVSWAIGSIFYRNARKPSSGMLAVAMQMLAGGAIMLVVALLRGELAGFSPSHVRWDSIAGWVYLTTVGSLVGYTAYIWLLHASTPARISTYAYVNPFIAVLLGCTVGHESFSPQLVMAGGLIVVAVILIVTERNR